MVWHKPGEKNIIPNTLSRLANVNRAEYDKVDSEVDILFIYHAILVEISPDLIKRILDGYLGDN